MRSFREKVIVLSAIILIGNAFSTQDSSATKHKPTWAQIEAAKKLESIKKKIANASMKKLVNARGDLKVLTSIANASTTKYVVAKKELSIATTQFNLATDAYSLAAQEVTSTHLEIGRQALSLGE